MTKTFLFSVGVMLAVCADAADPLVVRALSASEQAQAEVQRLAHQFDVVTENQESLRSRVVRLENAGGGNEVRELKAQVDALRAENASLRKTVESMREEIVNDIVKKLSALQPKVLPAKPAVQPKPAIAVPTSGYEHEVASGQTLSMIAREYETTVELILAANPGLDPKRLKIGQKIFVPDNPKKK